MGYGWSQLITTYIQNPCQGDVFMCFLWFFSETIKTCVTQPKSTSPQLPFLRIRKRGEKGASMECKEGIGIWSTNKNDFSIEFFVEM